MTLGALGSRPPRRATWYSERIKWFLAGDMLLVWMPNIFALSRRWTKWEMKCTTCGRGQGFLPTTGSVVLRLVIRSQALWVNHFWQPFFIWSTLKLLNCFCTLMNFKAASKGSFATLTKWTLPDLTWADLYWHSAICHYTAENVSC